MLLSNCSGRIISHVRRVHYVTPDGAISDDGPIELSVIDYATLPLGVGPDGESLKVDSTSWVDPFREPLSSENREFVASAGKWTVFDVTEDEPTFRFIGQTVLSVTPITNPAGKLTGVRLSTSIGEIVAQVDADELAVAVEHSQSSS